MTKEMTASGVQSIQAIKERLESVILKPYASLQAAFISEYEEALIEKVETLERHNKELSEHLKDELVYKQKLVVAQSVVSGKQSEEKIPEILALDRRTLEEEVVKQTGHQQ